jgi:hypothetical protein
MSSEPASLESIQALLHQHKLSVDSGFEKVETRLSSIESSCSLQSARSLSIENNADKTNSELSELRAQVSSLTANLATVSELASKNQASLKSHGPKVKRINAEAEAKLREKLAPNILLHGILESANENISELLHQHLHSLNFSSSGVFSESVWRQGDLYYRRMTTRPIGASFLDLSVKAEFMRDFVDIQDLSKLKRERLPYFTDHLTSCQQASLHKAKRDKTIVLSSQRMTQAASSSDKHDSTNSQSGTDSRKRPSSEDESDDDSPFVHGKANLIKPGRPAGAAKKQRASMSN